jgi:hypothetical protein
VRRTQPPLSAISGHYRNASLVEELDRACDQATQPGQPNVIVSASHLKAKLAGLLTDKVEISGSMDFRDCQTEAEVIDKLAASLGGDIHEVIEFCDRIKERLLDHAAKQARVIKG